MDILDKIVFHTREIIQQRRALTPMPELRDIANHSQREPRSLTAKLVETRPHIIAEFKRKSPSRPNINLDADPLHIAEQYSAGGASAMSVLTEPGFFGGSPNDLKRIRQAIDLPLLRKDFIIDPYQIYEAKALGADLILLIGRILDRAQIKDFTQLAHELKMEVLFEIHHLHEWDQVGDAPVDLLGVNCRDLTKFQTNLQVLIDMADSLPKHLPLVAESGIGGPADVQQLHRAGYRLFLVGEYLMRNEAPARRLAELWQ